jgi:hypothetical protein
VRQVLLDLDKISEIISEKAFCYILSRFFKLTFSVQEFKKMTLLRGDLFSFFKIGHIGYTK